MVEIDEYHNSFFTIVPGGCVFERDGGAPLPDPAVEVFLQEEIIYPSLLDAQNITKYQSWRSSAAIMQRNL